MIVILDRKPSGNDSTVGRAPISAALCVMKHSVLWRTLCVMKHSVLTSSRLQVHWQELTDRWRLAAVLRQLSVTTGGNLLADYGHQLYFASGVSFLAKLGWRAAVVYRSSSAPCHSWRALASRLWSWAVFYQGRGFFFARISWRAAVVCYLLPAPCLFWRDLAGRRRLSAVSRQQRVLLARLGLRRQVSAVSRQHRVSFGGTWLADGGCLLFLASTVSPLWAPVTGN